MSDLRKPARWAHTRGLVDPEWGYVFQGNRMFVPMWRSSGMPIDYFDKAILTVEGTPATMGDHPNGAGFTFVVEQGIRVSRDVLGGLSAFTVNVLVDCNNSNFNISKNGLFGRWTAGGTRLLFRIENTTTRVIRIIINTNGTDPGLTTAIGLLASGLVLVTLRYDGTTANIFMNGVKDANSGAGTGTVEAGVGTYFFSDDSQASQQAWAGTPSPIMYYGIASDYAWTDAQILKLARRPFGPLQMRDEAGVVYGVPAVGGVTLPIFDKHYRQMRAV